MHYAVCVCVCTRGRVRMDGVPLGVGMIDGHVPSSKRSSVARSLALKELNCFLAMIGKY